MRLLKLTAASFPYYCLAVYLIFWSFLAINPFDRFTWFLENILVAIFVPVLAFSYTRFKLSNLSYGLITAFLILHAIGSYYTYSEVPFVSSFFSMNFGRDHYDRLVHFTFGLLMSYPLLEVMRRSGVKRYYYATLAAMLSFSMFYELAEFGAARIFSPDDIGYFIGAQGDKFDSLKDIAMAALGVLTALAIIKHNEKAVMRKKPGKRRRG